MAHRLLQFTPWAATRARNGLYVESDTQSHNFFKPASNVASCVTGAAGHFRGFVDRAVSRANSLEKLETRQGG